MEPSASVARKRLGYLPDPRTEGHTLRQSDQGHWRSVAKRRSHDYRFCANAGRWAHATGLSRRNLRTLCSCACRHNQVIPDLSVEAETFVRWRQFAARAKRHLFYGLLRLRLPLETRAEEPGIAAWRSKFWRSAPIPEGAGGACGHHGRHHRPQSGRGGRRRAREARRTELGEPVSPRCSGHFRHANQAIITGRPPGQRWRSARRHFFATASAMNAPDYGDALREILRGRTHAGVIGASASSAPMPAPTHGGRFAATWAHFLHIVDALEMAGSFRTARGSSGHGRCGLACR